MRVRTVSFYFALVLGGLLTLGCSGDGGGPPSSAPAEGEDVDTASTAIADDTRPQVIQSIGR